MENVTTGIRKFANISRMPFVLNSAVPPAKLSEYSLVRKNARIFDPKLPIAKTTVFAASFLYLFMHQNPLQKMIYAIIIADFERFVNCFFGIWHIWGAE